MLWTCKTQHSRWTKKKELVKRDVGAQKRGFLKKHVRREARYCRVKNTEAFSPSGAHGTKKGDMKIELLSPLTFAPTIC